MSAKINVEGTKMFPLPRRGSNSPHVVIEVNQKCNISCFACYKDKFGSTKPLSKIIEEIEYALTQRKLTVISLAGGEPILHPEIDKIIKYIRDKNIMVQMLSNGMDLNKQLLKKLKEAGLNEIFLHIDKFQKRADINQVAKNELELNWLREEKADLILEAGITASLCITLYKDSLPEFSNFVNYMMNDNRYTRLFITCCTDFDIIQTQFKTANILGHKYINPINSGEGKNVDYKNKLENLMFDPKKEVLEKLDHDLDLIPFSYVPSELNKFDARWLFYYAFVIKHNNTTLTTLNFKEDFKNMIRVSSIIGKIFKRPISYAHIFSPSQSIWICTFYALLSFRIKTYFKTIFFLSKLVVPGTSIHQKNFTFQLSGPTVLEDGTINICQECPDATVRNGRLIPVCMADILVPLET